MLTPIVIEIAPSIDSPARRENTSDTATAFVSDERVRTSRATARAGGAPRPLPRTQRELVELSLRIDRT